MLGRRKRELHSKSLKQDKRDGRISRIKDGLPHRLRWVGKPTPPSPRIGKGSSVPPLSTLGEGHGVRRKTRFLLEPVPMIGGRNDRILILLCGGLFAPQAPKPECVTRNP